MTIQSWFTHPEVISNVYDILSSVEYTRYFEEQHWTQLTHCMDKNTGLEDDESD